MEPAGSHLLEGCSFPYHVLDAVDGYLLTLRQIFGINIHQKTHTVDEIRITSWKRYFIPLFIGFQPLVVQDLGITHPQYPQCSSRGIHGFHPGFHPQSVLFIGCFSTSLHHFPPELS